MRFDTAFIALTGCLSAALAAPIQRRAASANTLLVLKFANALEQLETEFYKQALAKFSDADFQAAGFSNTAVPKEQFTTIQFDEKTHTDVLASTLTSFGASAVQCSFDFTPVLKDVKTMAATARVVENLGVSAYLGAAALIDDPQVLNAAASIATVEARHQTVLNLLLGGSTVPSAFDMPLPPPQVLSTAAAFISSGCDLGVTPTPALAATNTGTIAPGTKLSLTSTAITGDTSNLTCQMLVGGAAFAIVLPYDNCVVPSGINGLVYLYAANTDQPLLANIQEQFAASIVAGPMPVFIDTVSEQLAQAVLGKSSSSSSTDTSNNNNNNGGSSSSAGSGASVSISTSIATSTISPDAASSIVASVSATATASASSVSASGSDGAASSAVAESNAAIAKLGGKENTFVGNAGPVKVLGWSEVAKGDIKA